MHWACSKCGKEHQFGPPGKNGVPTFPKGLDSIKTKDGFVIQCTEKCTHIKDLRTGDRVQVRSHSSPKGEGLSYPVFTGILLNDAGTSTDWEVVDVQPDEDDSTISIYAFSIVRSGK